MLSGRFPGEGPLSLSCALCWPPFLQAAPSNARGRQRVTITLYNAGGSANCPSKPAGSGGSSGVRDSQHVQQRTRPRGPLTLLAVRGTQVVAEQLVDPFECEKNVRLDLPSCDEPGALHLMLAEPPTTALVPRDPPATCAAAHGHGHSHHRSPLPPLLPPLVHHLVSLPVLPAPAAEEARRLFLQQVAAAPEGAAAALRCLSEEDAHTAAHAPTGAGSGSAATTAAPAAAPAGDSAHPPAAAGALRLWALLPAAAHRAVAWAWSEHFAPFAQDLCYVLSGPGPADARACLLESLLRFAAACGMTDTALLMLRACASQGVIRQVLMTQGAAAATAGNAIPAPGLAGVGFVVAGDTPPAAAAAPAAAVVAAAVAAASPPKRRRRSFTEVLLRAAAPLPWVLPPEEREGAWRGPVTAAVVALALVALLTGALLTAPVFGDVVVMLYS